MRRLLEELSLRPSPPWFDQWVDDGVGRRVGQQLIVELLDWGIGDGRHEAMLLHVLAAPQGNNASRQLWTLVRCWTNIGREQKPERPYPHGRKR